MKKQPKKPNFGEKMKEVKELKNKALNSVQLSKPRLDKTIEAIKLNPRI